MRTTTLRTAAGRAFVALGTLLALASWAAPPAAADQTLGTGGDRIFETRLDLGYRTVDVEDDASRLFPFDPLEDAPALGFELLYLTPGFGTVRLESGYLSPESWRAEAEYNHGADVDLRAASRAFTHAEEHLGTVEEVHEPISGMEIVGADADPGADYRDERRESTASLRVRLPGYPAHLRASGRVAKHEGDQQMRTFFRSCSTHLCHMDSRTRELDQETRDYSIGLDAHLGPVDLAYSHAAQTFRDQAPDPTLVMSSAYPGFVPAGEYTHDVNPDQRSFSDTLTLNTNLANRAVLSASYTGGEQENETSEVTRRTRSAGALLSWRLTPTALVTGRYAYDAERTADLGEQARALREARNVAHARTNHQHVVEPERTRHTGELSARFSPVPRADVTARVRHRTLQRYTLLEKQSGVFVDEDETTRSTLAGLDGRYRFGTVLALDATLGREWTSGPVYAIESTTVARYGLGATWTPLRTLVLRAAWQGLRGENDEPDALQRSWAARPAGDSDLLRTVTGNAYSASASFLPTAAFDLTLSWNLVDNGVEQDLLLGSPANAGYSFLSRDTDWSGRSQLASVRARWAASRRLTLSAGGLWVDSLESYTPTVAKADGLEELSTVDFTKLLGSLQAEVRLNDAVGLTLAAFWARFNDQADDAGDGTAEGLLAAVDFRW